MLFEIGISGFLRLLLLFAFWKKWIGVENRHK